MNSARAAAVINEFGGVEGFITMRDIVNFIFGEISGKAIWRGGTGEYEKINGPLTYKGEVKPTRQGSAKVDGDY